MRVKTIDELQDWEDNWVESDGLDEGEERNAWLEEGVELYKQFIQMDKREPRYSITLSELYLEVGRDEKIKKGNQIRAYETLRLATIHAPNKPDAFYHLSFVLAKEKRRWEAVLFYSNEALEKGITSSRRIKLLCNMALGYARLGYITKSLKLFEEARKLDVHLDHEWFIELYSDRIKENRREPILLKETNEKRKFVSREDYKIVIDDAMDGKCVVLDLTKENKFFRAIKDDIRLERKEAEILGYLMDHSMTSCPKKCIEESIWDDRKVSASAVKRYITSIRRKLSQAMGREDIAESVLITTNDGYQWRSDIPSVVLR
ncbi:helix-turn-helix domain-containing protein [Metabacillus halosaccharovorans]|uniref:Helix-turn-helix domain-containing protein n=1 Tax=Metabacillus halosaccharovorans TaxID=930124 RepID=A0ABT3DDL6_9BACI|nr:helix-turn-helix domain-containing protein [Metabacillus halosaccharovorans]MCV9885130.1 helix-turn-helix domain-containing protein [Metabacillus halosaccharovorans]